MADLTYDSAYRGDAPIATRRPEITASQNTRGNWPRMLVFDEEVENRLKDWIDFELNSFYQERGPVLEDWKRWQNIYWAEPAQKVKNFPFKRAANIVIPLAAIAVEAIHARLMNTLFSVEPFWSIRPRSEEWVASAKPMESYLQSEVENGETLRVYDFCNESLLEFIKLGTAVAKSGYEKLIKKSLRKTGDIEQEFFATVRNGATVERVPLANFIMRLAELDPQTAPLVGEEHWFTWSQLKRWAQSGRMNPDAIKEIKAHWTMARQDEDGSDEVQKTVEENANVEPIWSAGFKVHELWLSFDVDGDGWDEEIVVDYHRPSRTFLSARYNWYDDLHRPYRISQFLKVEGVWTGIGVCKQTEQFQKMGTTIHRQRLDNATLANMSQIVLRSDLGYGPGEPIFPGKMWFVDDPSRDIKEFKLSEVYPSSYANEESVVRYFEKRTGVNEVILGIPQQGTPGTATSDLTRLAEGNKKFDLVLKNVRRWLGQIGVDVITNYQIFGNQNVHWLTEGADGQWVENILNMPSVLIRRGAVVDLSVTDSITNRDVEQRQWLQLFQVITNYYDRVLQLAQILAQGTGEIEMFMGIAQRALMTSDEAMRRLLETFAVPDADRFSLIEEDPNAGPGEGPPANPPTGNLPPGVSNRLLGTPGRGGPTGINGNGGQPGMGGI